MKVLEALHKKKFRYVVADAGYDGEENFAWLMGNNYISCIKPATHERSKTRKWKQDISRAENMQYCQETDTFICTNGKPLTFQYERKKKTKSGFVCTSKVYAATCCDGCPFRKNCQKYKGDNPPKHPKHIYISTRYNELLKKNMEIFGSPYGTCLRINRSIQVEGVFGILKQDYGFWRLLHRGAKNVRKYMLLLAMGYNIKKLHNRNIDGRLGIRLFQEKISA